MTRESERLLALEAVDLGAKSPDLQEARRFFEWAQLYEQKGLTAIAEAMRDEGAQALNLFFKYGGFA